MTIRDEVLRQFIIECCRDWHGDHDPQAAEVRKALIVGKRKQDEAAYDDSMMNAKRELNALLERYADSLRLRIGHESTVGSCVDIGDLIGYSDHAGDDRVSRRIRCEARIVFDAAFVQKELDSANSQYHAGKGNNALIRMVTGMFVGSVDAEVVSHHDPDNAYRTAKWELKPHTPSDAEHVIRYALRTPIPQGLRVKRTPMLCRRLKDGRLVCMEHRVKERFEVFLKVRHQVDKWKKNPLEDGKPWDPLSVPDRSGVRFLVPDVSEAFEFAEDFRTFLAERGIQCSPLEENIRNGGKVDEKNPHSSKFFKAIKFNAAMSPWTHEVQILTFRDYFSSQYALGEENHELYKLSRCLKLYFPLFWPTRVYGVDWSDESVGRELVDQKIARLDWRVGRGR
jgi:hypothetical protein